MNFSTAPQKCCNRIKLTRTAPQKQCPGTSPSVLRSDHHSALPYLDLTKKYVFVFAWWPGRCNTTAGVICFFLFFAECYLEIYWTFEAQQHRSANCNSWRIVAVASEPPELHTLPLCDETCLSAPPSTHLSNKATAVSSFRLALLREQWRAWCKSVMSKPFISPSLFYFLPLSFPLLFLSLSYISTTEMTQSDTTLHMHNTHISSYSSEKSQHKHPHNIQLIHNRWLFSTSTICHFLFHRCLV